MLAMLPRAALIFVSMTAIFGYVLITGYVSEIVERDRQ